MTVLSLVIENHPAWYLLLVAILGILSSCQSLRDLERFAIRHHTALTTALEIELTRPPSDSCKCQAVWSECSSL
jgi:hypothetical protein